MSELALADAHRLRDPTGTAGHRRSFRSAAKLRVNQLRSAMRTAIMEQDLLGISGLASGVMAYHPHEVRLRAFAAWLDVTAYHILDGPWLSQYVAKAWHSGELAASKQLETSIVGENSAPVLELARLEMEGIISAIVQQLAREAARIVAHGRINRAMAWRRLSEALDKVGPPRVMALANTITVMAHNKAKVALYRAHGVDRIGIIPETLPRPHLHRHTGDADGDFLDVIMEDAKKAVRVAKEKKQQKAKQRKAFGRNLPRKPRVKAVEQWLGEEPIEAGIITAGDYRVCDECDEYAAGAPYDIDEVEDALPMHPNCRCTWFPWNDKRFRHDAGPPDFIKDPLTGQFGGSVGHAAPLTAKEQKQKWTEQTEQKRQAWLKKFGKPEPQQSQEPQFKNWKPASTFSEHLSRVKDILQKTAQISTTYRWQMKMYAEEGDKFAKSDSMLAQLVNSNNLALKSKIGESFYRQALKLKEKGGSTFEVNKLISKAAGLGYAPPSGFIPEAKPTETEIAYKKMQAWQAEEELKEQSPPLASANEVSYWNKTGPQQGSNPGGTYEDPADDSEWYVKVGKSEDHVANDLLTQRLYKIAGLNVPEQKKVTLDDMPAVASKIIDGVKTLNDASASEAMVAKGKLQEGFAVDAWLGNRDVIGLEKDNILISYKGGLVTPVRIDFGGGLKYRAQGQEKEFGAEVGEFTSLRDPKINAQSAAIFGDMGPHELFDSVKKVLAITPSQIMTEASLLGIPEVGETLKARRMWLADWASKQSGKPVPMPTQEFGPPIKSTEAAVTEAETTKASKAGLFYPAPTSEAGKSIVKPWNEKWATKSEFTQQELVQKVQEYKATKAKLESIATMEQSAQQKAQQEAATKAKAAAEATAKKAKEEEETAKAELHSIVSELGISPNDAQAVNAFIHLSGGSPKEIVDDFKKFQQDGEHQGLPISPFQYAMLMSYVGSGYQSVNDQLLKNQLDIRTHVFANSVNAALTKLPGWTNELKRGIQLTATQQEAYKPGIVIFWNAFSSCGKKSSFAKNTQFVITPLQNGKTRARDLGKINPLEAGGEVLYMARTPFKVTKVEQGTSGSSMKVWVDEVEAM